MNRVATPGYLRYPHVHGDLLTFVTEDDVWLAPAHLGDDLDVVLEREQGGEGLADHRLIFGDQDPDGVHSVTVAPLPAVA